jgi:hypothetical protein
MPTTPPVNTQQVLQMGTHTEKLQHTLQSLPNVTAQQVDHARKLEDELKRTQVQDMDPVHFLEETDPQTRAKKRMRVRKKNHPSDEEDNSPPLPEELRQGLINIIA